MFVSSYCPADLTAFPFDVQLCVVPVALVGHGTPSVDKEHLVITGGGQMLPVFRLLPLRCGFNPVEPMEVLMVMVLERRSEAFLLSAVGPCLVLGLLGHLSFLAFPLNHFSERANTSLSLLIVVAALFSQSVSTLPASASPKAIDVWFFYFILRFFLFFVCHCLVEFQRRRVSASPRHDQHTGRGGGTLEGEKEGMDALFVPGGKAPVEPTSSSSASQKTRTDMCHKRFPNKQLQQVWVTQGPGQVQVPRPLSPVTVNIASLLLGLVIDCVFLVAFFCYLHRKNLQVFNLIAEFDNCLWRR
ncbi:glycine receptor subunit alphaZ1-like [Cherax quadricarinatus]|uniref:glycine receptor subunit alphaZ1-like n=1 Tax=Cherax quadricarinatus TaxID=27406 RepID=UPI00387EB4DD